MPKFEVNNNISNMEELKYPTDSTIADPYCLPEKPVKIGIEDVQMAMENIKDGIAETPCIRSHLSDLTEMEIYLKQDFMQYTGSFKERGARHTLLMLPDEQKRKGVISASLGNHAQGVSYHGMKLNIPVTVVMPITAPIMKIQKCRKYKANVIVRGKDMGEAKAIAMNMGKEEGLTYINGYDHPHIMAGQGTIGLEILKEVPDVDAIIVPIGGGGLIAGIAVAVKAMSPRTQIIGVESERCCSFSKAVQANKPKFVPIEATLADGLAVPKVGYNAFETAKDLIDRLIVCSEDLFAIAILHLIELDKCVVEGGGAAPLAALLTGKLDDLKGKKVVLVLSGGNIDTTLLGRCLERGLAALGRLLKFKVTVSDRPGGIAELADLISSIGVSIKDIIHERAWVKSDIFSVQIKVICETRDFEHAWELKQLLESIYKKVEFAKFPSSRNAHCLGI